MKDTRPKSDDPNPESTSDALAALVRAAGPRAMPQAQQMTRARARVHAEWRASVASQRRGRRQWLAAAAAVVLAAGIGFFLWSRPETAVQVAKASRVSGDVQVSVGGGPVASLRSGAPLLVGQVLETSGDARALLSFPDGMEVRIDRTSRVQVDSPSALRLLEGTLYVDTRAGGEAAAGLTIHTHAGVVRHVGTRFEVRVVAGDTRVRVRDGAALFTGTDHAVVLIASGQQLSVSDGQTSLVPGPGVADAAWEWTGKISPAFDIEGRSLYDSVEWLGREAGLQVIYANDSVLARAQTVRVHGSIEGLATRDALVTVLTGSGFEFDLGPERVRISATEAR
jgi:ferric-dicitrate binding protein FerR (iron transport regulator)